MRCRSTRRYLAILIPSTQALIPRSGFVLRPASVIRHDPLQGLQRDDTVEKLFGSARDHYRLWWSEPRSSNYGATRSLSKPRRDFFNSIRPRQTFRSDCWSPESGPYADTAVRLLWVESGQYRRSEYIAARTIAKTLGARLFFAPAAPEARPTPVPMPAGRPPSS